MKRGLFLFLFLSSPLCFSGSEVCSLFEVKGRVQMSKDHLELVVAPQSQSEVILRVPSAIQSKYFPYLGHPLATEIVVKGSHLGVDTAIIQILKVERDIPDPLNADGRTSKHFIKEVPCL